MSKVRKAIFQGVVALALVGAGVVGMGALKAQRQEIKKELPPAPVPLVRTVQIRTGTQPLIVRGEGTVKPMREIQLVPQVGGKVVYVSPALVNGGRFCNGDVLLRIDPEDYRLAVTLAMAKIKDSESRLSLLEEEAAAARDEWRAHNNGKTSRKEPSPLVTKEPQLVAARAKLEADEADLRKADLSLERTELKTPFNGRVSQEKVGIGQFVSPGQALATLYGTDAAEIVVPLEPGDLAWFHVPGFTNGNGSGAPAAVKALVAGMERSWSGRVVRTEGKLDERTRMINVVVRVEHPYASLPPLATGLFVSVEIEGKALPGAAVIPRAALREGGRVWVVEEGRLRFRNVSVARIEGERVLVASGLSEQDQVVVSALSVVIDNMAVRTTPAEAGDRMPEIRGRRSEVRDQGSKGRGRETRS
jgi:RND family efflux transporter MFP subunit